VGKIAKKKLYSKYSDILSKIHSYRLFGDFAHLRFVLLLKLKILKGDKKDDSQLASFESYNK